MLLVNEVKQIYLGIQGENQSRGIEIDCNAWLARHPNGSISIWHKRNGDANPSATGAALDGETGILTWIPTSTDTYVAGEGTAEIRMTESGVIKKSREIKTEVSPAVTLAGEPSGSDWQDYINVVDGIKGDAVTAKNAAEAAQAAAEEWATGGSGGTASETNNAKYYSEQAADSAGASAGSASEASGYADEAEAWATGGSSGTPTATNNAKYYSEQASGSAGTAAGQASAAAASAGAADDSAEDAEAYATGKRDGVDVTSGDPAYHNNAKYYANEASGSATAASESASAASGSATTAGQKATAAEAWATGGSGGTASATNNAKYYSEQAAGSATSAGTAKTGAETAQAAAEAWATGGESGTPSATNNAKYYAEHTESIIKAAATEATAAATAAAEGSAEDAEAYAAGTRGGEDVESDDPAYHNNAKYYSEQAGSSATEAQTAAASASAAYGTALLAPNYSTTQTYAVGDHVIYSGNYYVCNTAITTAEAWTAAHWTQETVGGEASSLKSDFDTKAVKKQMMELCDLETVPASANIWDKSKSVSGGVSANGSTQSGSYVHQTLEVDVGDTIYLFKPGESSYFRWVCALDSSGNAVTASGTNTGAWSYTVPSGIKKIIVSVSSAFDDTLMVLVNNSTTPENYIPFVEKHDHYVATKEFLEDVNIGTVIIDEPQYTIGKDTLTKTVGAIGADGTVYSSYTSYYYSQKIAVVPGDVLSPISNETDPNFRFVTAYNGNTAVTGKGKSAGVPTYTVPDGIDGVVVSFAASKNINEVTHKHYTGIKEEAYTVSQSLGKTNWKGSLNSGDRITLLENNARFNTVWDFTGHIGTLNKIAIGYKPFSGAAVKIVEVDATKVYYNTSASSFTGEVEHGLTITEDLRIRIVSETNNILKGIYISSGNGEYSIIDTAYSVEMKGSPCLISTGSTMTDCSFSWIPRNIDKPIWVFGDSWVSMYETRWTYYMVLNGYDKSWFLNGFAGEKAEEGLSALKSLLTIRKPSYLVWLYGMNNGDSSAVNSTWKSVYDEVVTICNKYKINLILYTVPNTPTIDNTYKNAIVKASGYRYIDGVAAVGDDGSGNWFTGYEQSNTDHNHTSAAGAKALFNRILADFPEIAGNGL